MISLVIYNHRTTELKEMENYSHYLAGRLSEEDWNYFIYKQSDEFENFLKQKQVMDIICLDLKMDNAVSNAERIRTLNPHAYIILVADMSISPMTYMKPSIMAGSLLLREFTNEQLKEVFEAAFRTYLKNFEADENKEDVYVVDTREGRQIIPYNQIYYFEAREKKIVIGGATHEIVCYDTIVNLEEKLPEYFLRCHRSYIVNMNKAVKLHLSEGLIFLEDGIEVPISRTYKPELKKSFAKKTVEGGLL